MLDMFENYPLLDKDKAYLEHTRVPIVTVSGSFRDELAKFHHVEQYFGKEEGEVLFSRAHYSMALAAAVAVWKDKVDQKKAWLVDPTNYVRREDWNKIEFTETVGRAMARSALLKFIKDLIDTRVRQKLPITDIITTPLLHLFSNVHKPILSFHYETGNILAKIGKQVVQVVTDPHVRPQYLEYAQLPNIRFCVFDDNTRTSFLELAEVMKKDVDPRRVIVTGPPVDPRIANLAKKRKSTDHTKRPLRLVITTGGLGTNKTEIQDCLRSLVPLMRSSGTKGVPQVQCLVYVGVHEDLRESIHRLARQEGITTTRIEDDSAPLRVLYDPHIVEANELLIKYAFSWADGFVTKPSGDMAYDAAAAGCFLLTLEPWGEWEQNIREVFEQRGISRRAVTEDFATQLQSLLTPYAGKSWVEKAIEKSLDLPDPFRIGIQNILAQMPK